MTERKRAPNFTLLCAIFSQQNFEHSSKYLEAMDEVTLEFLRSVKEKYDEFFRTTRGNASVPDTLAFYEELLQFIKQTEHAAVLAEHLRNQIVHIKYINDYPDAPNYYKNSNDPTNIFHNDMFLIADLVTRWDEKHSAF